MGQSGTNADQTTHCKTHTGESQSYLFQQDGRLARHQSAGLNGLALDEHFFASEKNGRDARSTVDDVMGDTPLSW
jgi:hypothetical protein